MKTPEEKAIQIEALKESIVHWEENCAASTLRNIDISSKACALCEEYNNHDAIQNSCVGCPIFEKTGCQLCGGTPYSQVDNAKMNQDFTAATEASKLELKFLQDLLVELEK